MNHKLFTLNRILCIYTQKYKACFSRLRSRTYRYCRKNSEKLSEKEILTRCRYLKKHSNKVSPLNFPQCPGVGGLVFESAAYPEFLSFSQLSKASLLKAAAAAMLLLVS